jgi:hypothetical protein
MNSKTFVCFAAVIALMYAVSSEGAVSTSTGQKIASPPAVKSGAVPSGGPMSPVQQHPGKPKIQRPTLKMTCPDANAITLKIYPPMSHWSLTPNHLGPIGFARAYVSIDQNNPSKASLACLYHVAGDFIAATAYKEGQKCYCNESTGEGMVKYTGPSDYSTNIAGNTVPGNLAVKKTGQQIKDQKLECEFHADGQAQFFKKFQAPGRLLSCEATGRDVICWY